MVKVKGPLNSLEASGTLADVLTFQRSAGGLRMQKKSQPKHPRSRLQLASQAALRFLTREWKDLTNQQQATWAAADVDPERTPYLNYTALNFKRIRTGDYPSQTWPPNAVKPPYAYWTVWQVCGVRHVQCYVQLYDYELDCWGAYIYRFPDTSPFTGFQNIVAIIRADAIGTFTWTDSPLPSEPFTYAYRLFSIDGKRSPTSAISGPCTVKDQ